MYAAGSPSWRMCLGRRRTNPGALKADTTAATRSLWSTTASSAPRRCVATSRLGAEPRPALVILGAVQKSIRRDPAIWRSLDEIPDGLARTVVVIGNFDGVHLGHQHVIREARDQ